MSHFCSFWGWPRTNRDNGTLNVYVEGAAKIAVESKTTATGTAAPPAEPKVPPTPEQIDQLVLDDIAAIAEKVKNGKAADHGLLAEVSHDDEE